MARTVTRKELGAMMHHWHSSQSDPIYAVGSQLYAGQPVDEEQVRKARDRIRSLLRSAEAGAHGWGAKEAAELRIIEQFLGGLLRTYTFGEMPTLADFRTHLSHAKDDKGRRLISSGKPILTYDLAGNIAQAAQQGYQRAAQLRGEAGKKAPDMSVSDWGTGVRVEVNNIETLYDFIRGLVAVGGSAANSLAKELMADLGFNWTAAPNPARFQNRFAPKTSKQRQADAIKLWLAVVDPHPDGASLEFEQSQGGDHLFVTGTSWNGSRVTKQVGWDSKGPYVWDGGKYRWQPSERRPAGSLWRDDEGRRW